MECLGCGTEFQRDLLLKKHLLATQACLEAMGGSIEAARKMIKSHKGKVRYDGNPDPARERSRSRYASDPEKSREERNARYEENPEPDKERSRVYYEEHSEEIREKRKERHKENPEPAKERERVNYEEHGEEIRESRKERYKGNPEQEKEQKRVYYKEQGEEIREHRNARYEGNPEPDKQRERSKYNANPEPAKGRAKARYEEHGQERRDAIYAQRAATDSMEVLLNFRTKCRYGPSFPCIVCHELKFRGQVSAIKLEEIEDEFVTGDFIRRQSKLFLKHGSFHICTPCKSKVSRGELPKLAARNSLNCPWDNVPKQLARACGVPAVVVRA